MLLVYFLVFFLFVFVNFRGLQVGVEIGQLSFLSKIQKGSMSVQSFEVLYKLVFGSLVYFMIRCYLWLFQVFGEVIFLFLEVGKVMVRIVVIGDIWF